MMSCGYEISQLSLLDDAANFLIGAHKGLSDSDHLKPGFVSSAELGKYNAEELAQLEATGLFVYGTSDAISDFVSSNEEIVSRAIGGVKVGIGVVGMIGSAVGVTSGFGSVVAAGVGTGSTYYAKEGYDQAFGPFEHKEGARVLASFEKPVDSYALEQGKVLSTEAAFTLGGAVALKGAQALGSKVAQVVKSADLEIPKTRAPHAQALQISSRDIVGSKPQNIVLHEKQKVIYRRDMEKPYVKDEQLAGIVEALYRPDKHPIGSGSTAAAVRNEIITGEPTKGTFHTQKASDRLNELNSWLRKNPNANIGDRAVAENLVKDLQDALGTKQ